MNACVSTAAAAEPQPIAPRLSYVFDELKEAVFYFDEDCCLRYLNQKAKEIALKIYTCQPVVGKSILPHITTGRRKGFKKVMERVLEGETIEYEIEVEATAVWLQCKYFPSRDEQGSINGIYGLLKDITGKKTLGLLEKQALVTEQNLFQSKLLFAQFMQNSPLISWVTDGSGIMHYMNAALLKVYGYTEKDFGKSIYDLFDKQLASDYFLNNKRVLQSGTAIETIEKGLTADGVEQVLKIYKFPLTVNNETMVGGWAVDITDQMELQEKLIQSIERHEYVNEATSDAIYDWNFSTRHLYKSARFEELFGDAGKEVSLRHRLKHIHPQDVKKFKEVVFAALRDAGTDKWEIEYRISNTEGNYKTVLDKAFIIRSGQQVKRVIGALQDVSAQKALQQKLMEQEKRSKREVIKSIIEAQEKERRQLSVELHDNVNQMLASCKLMLEVAIENGSNAKMLTEKTYQSIQTVINEIRRISHDLNSSTIVDIGLVEAIEQLIEKINIAGKISICFVPDKIRYDKELAEEDKINIYRIVQEQLNNILKHAKADKVVIRLEVIDGLVKLSIKDNGVGFNPLKCKKGLGLRNICNRVEYYGGFINITSAIGEGCEMYVTLKTTPPLVQPQLRIA